MAKQPGGSSALPDGPAPVRDRHRVPGSLSAAMTVQFAAGGAVIPFITLLFRDRGLDLGQISLIFTVSSGTLLIFPFLWGMLADRFVPLNQLFALLNLLTCVALGVLAAQREFLGLLVAYACYFACFNPTLSLMNALSFHHLPNPREQFGKLRAWGSLGWILPFLPIALWIARDPGTELDFVLYLGMACSGAMVILSFWLPHTPPGAGGGPERRLQAGAYGNAIKQLLFNPNYLVLLGSMFLMAGSFSLFVYYSPPLLEDAGVPRVWIGPIQAIAVVFEIVLLRWQPFMLRRWNYAAIILAGCVMLVVRHVLFSTVENAWVLSASYLLAGMVIVFYHQGVSILVNTMAAREVRATAQTLLMFFGQGMGPLFANALAGRLTEPGSSLRPIFLLAALLAFLASLLIAVRARALNRAGLGGEGSS